MRIFLSWIKAIYSYFAFLMLNCTLAIHSAVASTGYFHYITVLCICHYAPFLKCYWCLIFREEYSKEIEFRSNAYTLSSCAWTAMLNYFELSSAKVIPLFCRKFTLSYSYLQRYHVLYVFVFVPYVIHEIILWFFIEEHATLLWFHLKIFKAFWKEGYFCTSQIHIPF